MRSTPLFTILTLLISTVGISQTQPITVEEGGFFQKTKYYKCDIELTDLQLLNLFQANPATSAESNSLMWSYTGYTVFHAAATVLILWPVSQASYTDNPDWEIAYYGLASMAIAIPLKYYFHKKVNRLIPKYNLGQEESNAIDLDLAVGRYGIGLQVNF